MYYARVLKCAKCGREYRATMEGEISHCCGEEMFESAQEWDDEYAEREGHYSGEHYSGYYGPDSFNKRGSRYG